MAAYMGNTGCTGCMGTPNNSPAALMRPAGGAYEGTPTGGNLTRTLTNQGLPPLVYASGTPGTPDAIVGQGPTGIGGIAPVTLNPSTPCGGSCKQRQVLTLVLLAAVLYMLTQR